MNWMKFYISYLLFFVSISGYNLKYKTGLICLVFDTVFTAENRNLSNFVKKEPYTKPEPFVFDSLFEIARATNIFLLFTILYAILFLLMIVVNWLFVGCSLIFLTITGFSFYILSSIFIIMTNPILLA